MKLTTSEIDVRHVLGTKLLFHTTIKLDDYLDTVRVQRLPAKEGIGFAVQVSYGGSGYGEVCTFGFRFQNGVVFYRTIAAKLKFLSFRSHCRSPKCPSLLWNIAARRPFFALFCSH